MTGSVASDGQTPITGNLQMGSNRITGLADGIVSTDAATVSQLTTAGATYLLKASNLSDVANVTTARGNLTAAKSGANSDITSITGLTTPLTVAQGGTGAATLTANNVLLGNGTSAPQAVAPSTSGNVLTSNGTTWVSSAPTATASQLAKAWVNSAPTTSTINAAYNVTSVVRNSTGNYTFTFTNAFANANYAAMFTILNSSNNRVVNIQSQTTTTIIVQCGDGVGTANDVTGLNAVFFG
jgi:hypothetical protein